MTTEPNRKPEGIPAGGQFAAQLKSDDVVSLGTPTRRPELNGWPESLPEPEVTFHYGDDGVITTNVAINGETAFEVWNPGDDVHSVETTVFDMSELEDDDISDAAENWAKGKHEQIADDLRAEMFAAVQRSRAGIMAKATGVPVPQSDEDLEQLVSASFVTYNAVQRDGELASTALLARGVLKEHPDAHAIGLVVSTADDSDYVSGAVVYNENREQIGYYDEEDTYNTEEDRPDRPFLQHLASLAPASDNAWWTQFNVRPVRDREDLYTIDLKQAAAWTPGSAA
jgi:hypothetical protein